LNRPATEVKLNPVSDESSVSDVLNKVTTGQADAGLVYITESVGRSTRIRLLC
jgi:molybdate transport system substrate-binding protein